MKLPEIDNVITIKEALELCWYFGLDYLIERIESHPERYKGTNLSQGGFWFNVRKAIMRDDAEIVSGALGHSAVAMLPDFPYYGLESWDKQRAYFSALDKPDEAVASEVYHFYQSASLHRHYILRELLSKYELVVV